MKMKRLTAIFVSLMMMTTMFISALSVQAALSAATPELSLTYGEYTVVPDGATTYYMVDVDLNIEWDGWVEHYQQGVPTKKSYVTGLASYGMDSTTTNGWVGATTYNHIQSEKAATKQNWLAGGVSDYYAVNGKLATYTIYTTDADAGTTFALKDIAMAIREITAGAQTATRDITSADYPTAVSIAIPSYNSTIGGGADKPIITASINTGVIANSLFVDVAIDPNGAALTGEGSTVTVVGDKTRNFLAQWSEDYGLTDLKGECKFSVGIKNAPAGEYTGSVVAENAVGETEYTIPGSATVN